MPGGPIIGGIIGGTAPGGMPIIPGMTGCGIMLGGIVPENMPGGGGIPTTLFSLPDASWLAPELASDFNGLSRSGCESELFVILSFPSNGF
jgi:hypothetical protein